MTVEIATKIGGILLAAGGSSRLGRPKQLLEFEGKTLIRRAAETLVNSACDHVIVVLGAEIEGSTNELAGLDLTVCVNEDWRTGMSSSIRAGLQNLIEIEPDLVAVVISLCDQPHVTADNIDELIVEFSLSKPTIVAAEYGKTLGVPALFSRQIFDDLSTLDGDKGARDLIRNCLGVVPIDLVGAAFDVDTVADAERLEKA